MDHPIIIFDGECNLCTGSVQFIVRHDPAARFRFASAQSPAGARLLRERGFVPEQIDTFVLIEGAAHYVRSDAALRIARRLSGAWRLLALLAIIPRAVRDPVYRLVSRNRIAWFGRPTVCLMPSPDLLSRFL